MFIMRCLVKKKVECFVGQNYTYNMYLLTA